jgi:hypothetical protein
MKPMASAVIERGVIGGIMLLGTLGFVAVALTQTETKRPVFVFLVLPLVLGTLVYWFGQRRFLSEIMLRERKSASVDRESPWRTRRRVASLAVLILAAMAVWAWLTDEPAIGGAILATLGGAELAAAFRLRHWERSHGVRVLHEPRWFGIVDSGEFQVVRNAGV